MQAASMLGNVAASATQVADLMQQMRGLLDVSRDPDRMALRHLGLDRMGWTRKRRHPLPAPRSRLPPHRDLRSTSTIEKSC